MENQSCSTLKGFIFKKEVFKGLYFSGSSEQAPTANCPWEKGTLKFNLAWDSFLEEAPKNWREILLKKYDEIVRVFSFTPCSLEKRAEQNAFLDKAGFRGTLWFF